MSDNENQKRELKIKLAQEANRLGQHRLTTAIIQAMLTGINLMVSFVILFHVIGGR